MYKMTEINRYTKTCEDSDNSKGVRSKGYGGSEDLWVLNNQRFPRMRSSRGSKGD